MSGAVLLGDDGQPVDFQDIERELAEWALTLPGVAASGNRTPANLETRLIFVRWTKIGGTDDAVTDRPLVDCDVFASSRDGARRVAETIRTSLRPRVRLSPGGAIIDHVRTSTSPRELPWSNESIMRNSATYSIALRR